MDIRPRRDNLPKPWSPLRRQLRSA